MNIKLFKAHEIKEMSAEDLVHWLGKNCPNDFDIIEEGGGTTTLIFSVREEEESVRSKPSTTRIRRSLKWGT